MRFYSSTAATSRGGQTSYGMLPNFPAARRAMALSFALVDGAGLSAEASRLLEEAWNPPAVHYTPNYLRWQLSFPSASGLPCAAAFDGSELAGFAGATARRLRHGSRDID